MWEWRGLKNKNFVEGEIDFSSMSKLKNDMKFYLKEKMSPKLIKKNTNDHSHILTVSEMAEYNHVSEETNKSSEVSTYIPQNNIDDIFDYNEEEMFEFITSKLDFYNLKNIKLRKVAYVSEHFNKARSLPGKFQRARRSFLKLLGYHNIIECMEAGIDDYEISLLKRGISPENYNVHLKIPYEFGGDLDFSNLCLLKTFPIHETIHKLIDLQIASGFLVKYKQVYIPYIEEKIYSPVEIVNEISDDFSMFE